MWLRVYVYCRNSIVANRAVYTSTRVVLGGLIGRQSGLYSVLVRHECVGVGRGYERFPLRICHAVVVGGCLMCPLYLEMLWPLGVPHILIDLLCVLWCYGGSPGLS